MSYGGKCEWCGEGGGWRMRQRSDGRWCCNACAITLARAKHRDSRQVEIRRLQRQAWRKQDD